MVICHYFLQGRCHFGHNCRNEHIYNSGPDNRGGRNSGNHQIDNIIWQISNEVIACEKGGQWPLSCFAPIKEGLSLPWWDDISFEEVRWTLYEARKNGTVNEAINQINQWYKKAESARNLLKHPTSEVIQILNDIIKGKKPIQTNITTVGGFPSPVNDPKTTFRFDTSINKLFLKSANQGTNSGSIFGNTSSTFQTQNIFGQSGQSLPSNNTSNIFSRPEQSHQNIFSNPSSTGHNIFTGQIQNQAFPNSNVSGQQIFQNQSPTNVFAPSAPIFGVPNPVVNNPNTSTNIFGNVQNNPFPFQSANPSQEASMNPVKIDSANFSNAVAKDVDFSIYSKTEDLNDRELKSYNSTTFTFGNIPMKPPPQQFC